MDAPKTRPSTKGDLPVRCVGNTESQVPDGSPEQPRDAPSRERPGHRVQPASSKTSRPPPCSLPTAWLREERQAEGQVGSETLEEKEQGCFCRLCTHLVHRTGLVAGPASERSRGAVDSRPKPHRPSGVSSVHFNGTSSLPVSPPWRLYRQFKDRGPQHTAETSSTVALPARLQP